eukprot:5356479-Karenia_brevis.AAC.1
MYALNNRQHHCGSSSCIQVRVGAVSLFATLPTMSAKAKPTVDVNAAGKPVKRAGRKSSPKAQVWESIKMIPG